MTKDWFRCRLDAVERWYGPDCTLDGASTTMSRDPKELERATTTVHESMHFDGNGGGVHSE